ncbi:ankyrin repeat domain-containing protein [Endozoicomonas sp. SCSIO W0465]|uniref:ankyrin repeat domain-containing protein n=1 Tax=Endozoicomonas sp. SCSIO W0465 TaxID=2918516 RepID=UPI0020756B3B|nr:ankyrin repeat domain-containing protein [Endozoicomonas sp. SCSIO W0465]USE37206.1 ankyrin repeat domain-containing protein [Endozoicomonas sp. SCSIO W0465]
MKIDDNEFDNRMATACLSGNIKKVNELLSIRPAGIHRFQKYSGMSTALHPLHLAAIKNNSELINKLCKYPEIDINVRNHAGQTPLMLATANNNLEAMKVLLNHPGTDINVRNNAGQTPLWISIAKNNVQAVEILLNHGAEIKKHPKKLYESLLYAAIAGDKELYEKIDEQRNPAILELLLNRGANANKTLGSEGITPLQVAAHFGDIKSIDILVKHGADVRKKNDDGATPMHLAAFANNIEVVKRLLQHGATLEEDRGTIDGAFIFKRQDPWKKFEISDLGCLKDRSDEGFKRTAALRFYEAGLGRLGRPLSFLKNEDHGALRAIEQEQIMLRKQQLSKQHNNQSGPTSCRLF